MTREPLELFRRTLFAALRAGARALLRQRRKPLRLRLKGPVDPVTAADKAAERGVLRVLTKAFPGHNFLTEESSPVRADSPYRWIVDPLDGTINYAHGLGHSCVSVALEKSGRVLVGGVYDPFRKELFWAVRGRGAFLNRKRIRVSRRRKLIESLLVTGFPYDRYKKAGYYVSFYRDFLRRTQGIRRLGAAALDMAYVACGRFEGYWEFNIKPWDSAAGWLLVEEAGGRVTDFRGRPYRLSDTRRTLCSNGRVHAAMSAILRRGQR